MPASLENKVAKAEAALSAGLATPSQRNDYAMTVIKQIVVTHIRTAMFCGEDDPAAAIRKVYNAELHHWRRYPVQYDPQGTNPTNTQRHEYQLYDDGNLEALYRALVRDYFDNYSNLKADGVKPYQRPHYKDPATGDRVPVFHYAERGIVEAWYMEPATCGGCDTETPQLCAPAFVLQESDAHYFDLTDEQWQALANASDAAA